MRILGLSAFYHDSAAALVEDGRIVAAAQEERFTRKKHDARFPRAALAYCLGAAGITLDAVDHVVFYDKPFLKFERLLETYLAFAPKGFRSFRMAIPLWLREKLFQKQLLKEELGRLSPSYDWENRLLFAEHHQSHAASAFFPSPFEEAAVLTMDGVGEWATTSVAEGRGNRLEMLKELHFPHSLGLLYSAFTYYTGFKVNSGEYKVMGLAPYGEPKYARLILEQLMDLKPDGTFRLDQSYFDYCTGLKMTGERFDALFGGPARRPDGASHGAAHGPRRLGPGGDRGSGAAPHALARRRDGRGKPLPCRRRRAQLRRQRQGPARRKIQAHLGSAGGGRCRRRNRCCPCRLPHSQGRSARDRQQARRDERVLSRSRHSRTRSAPSASERRARASTTSTTRRCSSARSRT